MSTIRTRVVASALQRKGFVKSQNDHTFFWLIVAGRKTSVRTKVSHGARECGEPLVHQMAKDLRLKKKQFLDFIECPMSKKDYVRYLMDAGMIRA